MSGRHLVRAVTAVVALWSFVATTGALAQAPPVVTSNPPGAGQVGVTYGHQFTSTPVDPPASFSVTNGSLPPGLTMGANGLLLGNPTQAGTFGPTTVCASNAVSATACQTFTITINKANQTVVATPSQGGPLGTAVRHSPPSSAPRPQVGHHDVPALRR